MLLTFSTSRSNEQRNGLGTQIRQEIFGKINGCPNTQLVNGQPITITWRTTCTQSSAYYHSDNIYIDRIVKRHTELLLQEVIGIPLLSDSLAQTDNQLQNVFGNGLTGLAFIVTKPLTREIVLIDDA